MNDPFSGAEHVYLAVDSVGRCLGVLDEALTCFQQGQRYRDAIGVGDALRSAVQVARYHLGRTDGFIHLTSRPHVPPRTQHFRAGTHHELIVTLADAFYRDWQSGAIWTDNPKYFAAEQITDWTTEVDCARLEELLRREAERVEEQVSFLRMGTADASDDVMEIAPGNCPRDAATEARNKWIYDETMKGTTYTSIVHKLSRKPKTWGRIETDTGVKKTAQQYAKERGLPLPPRRKRGRPTS